MDDGRTRRRVVGALAVSTCLALIPSVAWAKRDPTGSWSSGGSRMHGMGEKQMRELASQTPKAANASSQGPWYRFASTSYCSSAPPGNGGDSQASCSVEYTICNPTGRSGGQSGPAVRVWQMEVDRTGTPVPQAGWEEIGYTCFSDLVPGADNVLTMQMIINQFHDTKFAKPTTSIQPVGLKTLVNLPTYYELKWPEQGFEPGEADTTTLVGRRVDIEPVFRSATYIYGDGESSGPIKSLGGPHPTGDVIHTYRKKMVAPVQINATYSGRFRVDGGEWITIPDTVTIEGTPSNLTVAEAKARLYNN